MDPKPTIHCITCGSWYLRQTARAFQDEGALAGLWISDKNSTGIDPSRYHRCWPFHLAMKPFYYLLGRGKTVRWHPFFYGLFPLWRRWIKTRKFPPCNVVHAIGVYATEAFDYAEKIGALKVFDAANSHPVHLAAILAEEYKRWHGKEFVNRQAKWYVPREVRDLDRADLVLCPSDFVYQSMIKHGVKAEKCFVLPFGADLKTFTPRKTVPTTPRFVCVGDLCLRKGHPYLVRAFQMVKDTYPRAELICIGNIRSDFMPEYKRWKNTFTHYHGMPHNELSDLLKNSTAFVLASVEEGYARVLAEAMASGLPIIATHETGATTTITHGVEGLIIPSRNIEALAQAMIELASDLACCEKMGRNAARKMAQHQSWHDYGKRLLEEYSRRLQAT